MGGSICGVLVRGSQAAPGGSPGQDLHCWAGQQAQGEGLRVNCAAGKGDGARNSVNSSAPPSPWEWDCGLRESQVC